MLISWIKRHGRKVAFLVALVATVGSLFTSHVFGWSTCTLCTAQRIFMYPLVPILGWMIITDVHQKVWVIVPAALGGIVSAYHHLLVRFDPTQGCGFALPCSMEFGFYLGSFGLQPMFLPALAGTAFVMIIVFSYVSDSQFE